MGGKTRRRRISKYLLDHAGTWRSKVSAISRLSVAITLMFAVASLQGCVRLTTRGSVLESLFGNAANDTTPVRVSAFTSQQSDAPILHNPYMGWVLEVNTVEGLPPATATPCTQAKAGGNYYPEIDTIEVISTWGDIERKEGVFDWSRLDAAINLWEKQGKRIRLRVSTEDIGPYYASSVPQDRMGTPGWVYNSYGVRKEASAYDNSPGWSFADVSHPGFQLAASRFVSALAARYGSDPNIEVVSLRGYGAWGEWHDGHPFPSESVRAATLRQIVSLWMNAWAPSGKILSLPVSYDCQGLTTAQCSAVQRGDYGNFKQRSAYDHALTFPLLTFNKDCVGHCTQSNEYKLMDEAYSNRILPLIGEPAGFYSEYKNGIGNRSLQGAINDAVKQHLNYLTVLGWSCDLGDADAFYNEQKPYIASALNQIGYRLVLNETTLPAQIQPGATFDITTSWANKAAGHFYGKYALKLTLVNDNRETVWESADTSFDLAQALARSNSAKVTTSHTFARSLPPGSYTLLLSIADRQSLLPKVQLAIEGRDEVGRYPVGKIQVTAPTAVEASTPNSTSSSPGTAPTIQPDPSPSNGSGSTDANGSSSTSGNAACAGYWSACSASCDGGTETYLVTAPASGGGAACPFATGTTRACNTQACVSTSGGVDALTLQIIQTQLLSR